MGTELLTKVMLGQTLVLMQMPFLNNVRKVGRLVLSRTSCPLLLSTCTFYKNSIRYFGQHTLCITTATKKETNIFNAQRNG
jgi:hypothetical protein